ncbi:MAG: ABC transporter permease subunit [SAR324 cluster bacterium]|nr:ABC transporter permease subunit [SAR324 cluster bacterium]
MGTYFLRRLLLMIPTLIGVSLLVFTITQLVPGGPIDNLVRQMKMGQSGSDANSTIELTEEYRQALEALYGFDKPAYVQYLIWMKNVLSLDFGESYEYQEPVLDVILYRLPVSLSFGIWTFFAVYLLSIPLGVFKAIKENSTFDVMTSFLLFFAYSIPHFALAILLIVFFGGGSFWEWFPIQGLHSDNADQLPMLEYLLDYFHHLFLPLFCYMLGFFAVETFMMKNSFIAQISQDYTRTARAKGLPEKMVYFKHVLKNALIPIATSIGSWVGLFLAGSILLEYIFGLEGIGLLNYESIQARDYPVVLAIIMLSAMATLLGNFVSDVLYVILDPRITYD